MTTREHVARPVLVGDLCLITPPNWTAIGFLAVLAGLHFCIAIPAFLRAHWEGYMSLIFGVMFAAAAMTVYFMRYRMIIDAAARLIHLRTGLPWLASERVVCFDEVCAVRVTEDRTDGTQVELLCEDDEIECPLTPVPRQQALLLAITLRVELIKVCSDVPVVHSDRPL